MGVDFHGFSCEVKRGEVKHIDIHGDEKRVSGGEDGRKSAWVPFDSRLVRVSLRRAQGIHSDGRFPSLFCGTGGFGPALFFELFGGVADAHPEEGEAGADELVLGASQDGAVDGGDGPVDGIGDRVDDFGQQRPLFHRGPELDFVHEDAAGFGPDPPAAVKDGLGGGQEAEFIDHAHHL